MSNGVGNLAKVLLTGVSAYSGAKANRQQQEAQTAWAMWQHQQELDKEQRAREERAQLEQYRSQDRLQLEGMRQGFQKAQAEALAASAEKGRKTTNEGADRRARAMTAAALARAFPGANAEQIHAYNEYLWEQTPAADALGPTSAPPVPGGLLEEPSAGGGLMQGPAAPQPPQGSPGPLPQAVSPAQGRLAGEDTRKQLVGRIFAGAAQDAMTTQGQMGRSVGQAMIAKALTYSKQAGVQFTQDEFNDLMVRAAVIDQQVQRGKEFSWRQGQQAPGIVATKAAAGAFGRRGYVPPAGPLPPWPVGKELTTGAAGKPPVPKRPLTGDEVPYSLGSQALNRAGADKQVRLLRQQGKVSLGDIIGRIVQKYPAVADGRVLRRILTDYVDPTSGQRLTKSKVDSLVARWGKTVKKTGSSVVQPRQSMLKEVAAK